MSRVEHPLAPLATGFKILQDLLPETGEELYLTLWNLASYSLAVDNYINSRPNAFSLRVLIDQRNFVQHRLMSLSPDDNNQDGYSLQQACWLAGVVYSLITVFPIPHSKAPFTRLGQQIRLHLATSAMRWQKTPELILWITAMGALATVDEVERTWYTSVLERLLHRSQILSWQSLKDKLQIFLWFQSTSDSDGQQLWKDIHASNPFA